MSYRGRIASLLCLVLAGCTTVPRQNQNPASSAGTPPEVAMANPGPPPALPFNSIPMPAQPQAPAPGQPPAPHVTDGWVSLEHWSQESGFSISRHIAEGMPVYSIVTSNGSTLTVPIGSRLAHWNGVEFRLGFNPQIVAGLPYVHALDVQKNFEPLLSLQSGRLKPAPVIVIDPGHGGTDTGARSVNDGRCEKDFTLDLATRLQALLLTNGWTVLLTRSNDQNVALSARVAFAEQHGADLFVSLHFNSAAPSKDQIGVETYCLTPTGMPSNLTRGYEDNAALAFPNNTYDTQNLQLAMRLHRAVLKINGKFDRGVRRARFLGVLQGQNRPAVLVEGGYLSNPSEARQIANPSHRQKLAEALAGALLENSSTDMNLVSHASAGKTGTANGRLN